MTRSSPGTKDPTSSETVYHTGEQAWNRIIFELGLENRVARGEKVDVWVTRRSDGVVEVRAHQSPRGEVRVIYDQGRNKRNE